MIYKKREDTNYCNMRNERRDITTDPITIKRIIKIYYKQLYDHKYDNLDEVDYFFERSNIQKLIPRRNRQSE